MGAYAPAETSPMTLKLVCEPVKLAWSAPEQELQVVAGPDAAAEVAWEVLSQLDREGAVALWLNTKHALLSVELLAIGTIDTTFMHPREVLRRGLMVNASAFVVAHNHPSGDPTPSDDDIAITRRIAAGSEVVGVQMLDHIVMGSRHNWVSMSRRKDF